MPMTRLLHSRFINNVVFLSLDIHKVNILQGILGIIDSYYKVNSFNFIG